MNSPDTSSMDYKYGIWYKIKGKGWNAEQIHRYMSKKGYPVTEEMTREELIEELRNWEK